MADLPTLAAVSYPTLARGRTPGRKNDDGAQPAEPLLQARYGLQVARSRQEDLFNKIRRLVAAASDFKEDMGEVMDLRQSEISDEIGRLLASADDLGEELGNVANALIR